MRVASHGLGVVHGSQPQGHFDTLAACGGLLVGQEGVFGLGDLVFRLLGFLGFGFLGVGFGFLGFHFCIF